MHAPNVKPEVSAGQDWRSTSLVTIESSADRGQVIDCGYGHMVYVPDDGPFLHRCSCGQTFERRGWTYPVELR